MPVFLADANFDRDIVRGLLQRKPDIDILRAQELGFERTPDPDLLEPAAQEQRVILTHDFRTMPGYAYARIDEGKSFAGLVQVRRSLPLGRAIEDILLLLGGLEENEWENQIHWVPL